jgi:acetyl esterase/lipase
MTYSMRSDADGLVRVYTAPGATGTALVWVHGGGFVAGGLDEPEPHWVASRLAVRGTTVVSVDYRLAREGLRYPVPLEDVLTAWKWTLNSAADLGVDASRVALGGASAGGNLVAGATLRLLADPAAALPARVVLAYPTLLAVQPPPDAALRTALDANPAADRFHPDSVRRMYENYLGGPVDGAPTWAVPGLATTEEMRGFPPTLILNSDVDELRVSGEAFGRSLAAAGGSVEVVVESGTEHGHLNRPQEPAAGRSLARIAAILAASSRRAEAVDLPRGDR